MIILVPGTRITLPESSAPDGSPREGQIAEVRTETYEIDLDDGTRVEVPHSEVIPSS
ncbi:hypothetical protein [Streptomyces sp. NPDC054784]